jgi:hypothetical protein
MYSGFNMKGKSDGCIVVESSVDTVHKNSCAVNVWVQQMCRVLIEAHNTHAQHSASKRQTRLSID